MGPDAFVVVIGSGAAGESCARTLAAAGVRVAVVEDDKVGGTCIWHGCMPKKALYQAAEAYLDRTRAEQYGVGCERPSLDWESVLAWKWHAQESYAGDQAAALAEAGIELVRGTARFTGPLAIDVSGRQLQPSDVVIACGSATVVPAIPGAEGADTSEEALHYPCPPASLAIVGAGAVAFEFAAIYAAFGVSVTMLVRSGRMLADYDPAIVAVARARLEALGVVFRLDTAVTSIECGSDGARVTTAAGPPVEAERVLLATGRRSRVPELDPAAAGLSLDTDGLPEIDALGRTSDPHVWVAGDARGGPMHTPLANAEGRQVALAMLGEGPSPVDPGVVPSAVFTFPQLARVGIGRHEAEARGVPHIVHAQPLRSLGAAIVSDDRDGLVQLVAGPEGRVLGAEIAAPHAADLIYAYALAVASGISLADIRGVPGVHPALSQALEWAAW